MKTCRLCKKELPATLEYFYYDSKVKSGLRSRCKTCINEGNLNTRDKDKARLWLKKWREDNPDAVKAQNKRANQNPKNQARRKKYYEDNKEKVNTRRNLWGHSTGKFTEYNHKRRDLILRESVSLDAWLEVVEYYGNRCLVPGCSNLDVTQDHLIPLSRAGRNHISNMQPLCGSHNCQKQAKTIDYRPDKGLRFASEA